MGVDVSNGEKGNVEGAKGKFFWGDDNEVDWMRPGYDKRGRCSPGYNGGGTCKCTCVWGKSMVNTGDMKAMLPYRGPGDHGYYKRPYSPGTWNDIYGQHHKMYATYCVGVCGADCDGPKWNNGRNNN